MRKIISTALSALVLSGVVVAQSKKPSQAMRQVAERRQELFKKFDREVSEGKAQSYEWEARLEMLRRFAAESAAGFKIADWQGEELRALATLNQFAEDYASAAEAFRVLLIANPEASKERGTASSAIIDVRASYGRALIEIERLEEAKKVLEEMGRQNSADPGILASTVALHKDLAAALRDRGRLADAAAQARTGYEIADLAKGSEVIRNRLREMTLRDQFSLAAMYVAINEKLKKFNEAEKFNKLVMDFDFEKQPDLRAFYESELVIARLIGSPAPELVASEWLDSQPRSDSEMRGKVILIDFWAMWCGPCIAAFPHLRDYQAKYSSKGFEVVGATRFYGRSDKEEDLSHDQELKSLQEYKRKHQLSYPFAVGKMDDVTNEERFGVISLPTVILVDRGGKVRHIKRGVGEYNRLERQIVRLVEE